MKKYLATLAASSLITASLLAKADFYVGYEISSMSADNAANQGRQGLDETIQGMGLGMRLYTDVNADLDIGGEFGFSHLETRSEISGNIAHGQFILKYHLTPNVELIGGLGVALRGTPTESNTSVESDATLTGGLGSVGIAYVTDNNWRYDITYHYISFSGNIDNEDETISTSLFGFHVGKTFDVN